MLYIVEMLLSSDELTIRMAQMRTWLDHAEDEPAVFRSTRTEAGIKCRVDFGTLYAAHNFARAFGGTVLSRSTQVGDLQGPEVR